MPRSTMSYELTESLIRLVSQNPALYDPSCVDYKNTTLTNNIWKDLARELDIPGMTGESWKKKWRLMRDTYVRKKKSLNALKPEDEAKKIEKWPFMDIMGFLDMYIGDACTELDLEIGACDEEALRNESSPGSMPRSKMSYELSASLIELVKQSPALYDPSSVEYKNSNKIWQGLAKAMDIPGMTGESWKKKWRSLRDTYVRKKRLLNGARSGDASINIEKWPFLDMMDFLDKYMEGASTELDFDIATHDEEAHSNESFSGSMPRKMSHEVTASLIELVKQNPALYDPSSAEYKKSNSIWKGLAKALDIPGMTGESWKKKWRTLRDTYVRKKKLYNAAMSEDEARKVEKWCFLDMMGFLDKYTEGASMDFNFEAGAPDKETEENEGFSGRTPNVLQSLNLVFIKEEANDESTSGRSPNWLQSLNAITMNEEDNVENSSRSLESYNSPGYSSSTSPSPVSPAPSDDARQVVRSKDRTIPKRRSESSLESAFVEMVKVYKKRCDERNQVVKRDPEDAFFESCSLRVKKLPTAVRGLIQVQISEILYHAETQAALEAQTNLQPSNQDVQQPSFQTQQKALSPVPQQSSTLDAADMAIDSTCVYE